MKVFYYKCKLTDKLTLQIWKSHNLDRNKKNKKFCSHFRTNIKRHMGFRNKRTFRLFQGQLERRPWISASDKGRNCCSDFLYSLSSVLPIILNVLIISLLQNKNSMAFSPKFVSSFRAIVSFMDLVY